MTARTYGELTKLVADLPAEGAVVSPAMAPAAKEVARIDIRSGHVQRVDRWVVPQRMDVKVTSGHVKLDFTQAVITQPSLKLDIDVRSGHVRLVTKPGIVVDADDVAIRSGHVEVGTPWGSDVPVQLRIEVTGKVGSGHFLAGPPCRTFWEWLTRKPKPYVIAARPPLNVTVVSGAPGTGKSTIANALGSALRFPVLSLDPVKEALADVLGLGGEDWSNQVARRGGGSGGFGWLRRSRTRLQRAGGEGRGGSGRWPGSPAWPRCSVTASRVGLGPGARPDRPRPASHSPRRDQPARWPAASPRWRRR